jgi:hypothetical protein
MTGSKRIVAYAWLLLLTLLYPLAIKEVHHHTGEGRCQSQHSGGLEFNRYSAESCAICDFEFLQYISQEAWTMPVASVSFTKILPLSIECPTIPSGSILRLRAPPVR